MTDSSEGARAGGPGVADTPRVIALVGPFGSGKSSLLNEILRRTGSDIRQDAAPAPGTELNIASCEFMGDRYTFIDCPGSVEFALESDAALDSADAAIVVAEADPLRMPALQAVMQRLEARGLPRMLFLNKVDALEKLDEGAGGLRDVLAEVQSASAAPFVLRQLPLWEGSAVVGFTDLALERTYRYRAHEESERDGAGDGERPKQARFAMLEALADHDDVLMEQLLEDEEPQRDDVFGNLVRDMREGLIVPAFIGSAAHGNGIVRLLKALRHETPGLAATRERLGIEGSATTAHVIKTIHALHGGKLSVARVVAGELSEGDTLAVPGGEARPSGVYALQGSVTSKVDAAKPGEIVALGKLENVATGDLLGQGARRNAAAPPGAVMKRAIRPARRTDEVKLSTVLSRMAEEDPSLVIFQRPETGETVLGGQGEMHLRAALDRLSERYGLTIEADAPRVPYRETIRSSASARGRHKKQSGGHGQFGDVVLEARPLERGEGIVFSNTITGGVVPKQYIPAVEAGVREALENGPLGGFPVVDVAVNLSDGSFHSVDSSDQAFRMAGILAMRELLPQASPVLLEPILKVDVVVPSHATPRVNALVAARRGQLMGFEGRDGWNGWDVVHALIPEAEIGDLIIELRSATAGVGSFEAEFHALAEVHGRTADDVLRSVEKQAA